MNDIPVLWVCGPPGVGKTTVGWEIFRQLSSRGTETGYVDIDQLGLCYPAPATDPGRHRTHARNLETVLADFRKTGAKRVIVSGVIDPIGGVPELPGAALTVCGLSAEPALLRERFLGRGGSAELLAALDAEATAMRQSNAVDVRIDIGTRSVAEVARLVLANVDNHGERVHHDPLPAAPSAISLAGPVIWLCGVTAVGKSTVGWQLLRRIQRAEIPVGYVDLAQLAFRRPTAAGHRAKARNLARMWQTYRANGARCLVVVGPVEDRHAINAYTAELPGSALKLYRLHAGRSCLTERIFLRGKGYGPQLPGDELKGLPEEMLRDIADRTATQAQRIDRAAIGDVRIATEHRDPAELAEGIFAQLNIGG